MTPTKPSSCIFPFLVGLALPLAAWCQPDSLVGPTTYSILGDVSAGAGFNYIIDITTGYSFTPNDYIQVTAVRSYGGDKVSIWTDAGVRLTSQEVSGPGFTWSTNLLDTPITLSPNTSYYLSDHFVAGTWIGIASGSSWPTTFHNGTVGQNLYFSGYDAFPTILYTPLGDTSQGPLVDLNYVVVPEPNSLVILACGAFLPLLLWRKRPARRGMLQTPEDDFRLSHLTQRFASSVERRNRQ